MKSNPVGMKCQRGSDRRSAFDRSRHRGAGGRHWSRRNRRRRPARLHAARGLPNELASGAGTHDIKRRPVFSEPRSPGQRARPPARRHRSCCQSEGDASLHTASRSSPSLSQRLRRQDTAQRSADAAHGSRPCSLARRLAGAPTESVTVTKAAYSPAAVHPRELGHDTRSASD